MSSHEDLREQYPLLFYISLLKKVRSLPNPLNMKAKSLESLESYSLKIFYFYFCIILVLGVEPRVLYREPHSQPLSLVPHLCTNPPTPAFFLILRVEPGSTELFRTLLRFRDWPWNSDPAVLFFFMFVLRQCLAKLPRLA